MVIVSCGNCGKKVERNTWNVRRNKYNYCSRQCAAEHRWKDSRINISCSYCGKSFIQRKNKIKRNKENYCSKECYIKSQKGKPFTPKKSFKIRCDNCKKEFDITPSRFKLSKNHFCSRKCKGKYISKHNVGENHINWRRTEKVICGICKKEFYVTPYRFDNNRGKFCSKKCFYIWLSERMRESRMGESNPNWQGGLSKEGYPTEFINSIFKKEIRAKYNFVCQICGKTEKDRGRTIHIHHIDRNKLNLSVENIIPLCIHCHPRIHHKKDLVISTDGSVRVPRV